MPNTEPTSFTPGQSLAGGIMIGLACGIFLLFAGKISGISGVIDGVVKFSPTDFHYKSSYLSGLIFGMIIMSHIMPDRFDQSNAPTLSWITYIVGGLLVGFGTRLSNGCTSGHGVCGVSRLSPRSIIATAQFMITGIATSTIMFFNGYGRVPESTWDDAHSSVSYFMIALAFVLLAVSFWGMRDNLHFFVLCLACSLLFAAGLVISGMTLQAKIFNFLTISSQYDPSLIFVMGGAIPVFAAFYFYISKNMIEAGPILSADQIDIICDDHKQVSDEKATLETQLMTDSTQITSIPAKRQAKFSIPTNTVIDWRLLLGASCFGVGWGLVGVCPAPCLGVAAGGYAKVLIAFIPAMIAGMWFEKLFES